MAADERLTDAQLVSELAKYGERIELPLKRNKRPVLVKKLNHLRVRSNKEKSASFPSKINQSEASAFNKYQRIQTEAAQPTSSNAFSYSHDDTRTRLGSGTFYNKEHQSNFQTSVSDDSDWETGSSNYRPHAGSYRNVADREPISNRPSTVYHTQDKYSSHLLNNTPRHRTQTSSRAYDFGNDNSTFSTSTSSDNIHNDDDEKSPAPGSKLYPDLSKFTSLFSSRRPNDRFESSDSDDDQVNKSFPHTSRDARHRHRDVPSSSYSSRRHQDSLVTRPYRTRQLKSPYLAQLPRILMIIAILVFVLAVTYIVMNGDFFLSWLPSSGSDDIILVCSNTTKQEGCFEKEVVDKAFPYLGKLFESLSLKKGQVLCGDARAGEDIISITALQSQMYKHFSDKTNVELVLECCLQHILVNPHWKIRALQENGTLATNKDEVARLESGAPSMSVSCRLRRSCFTVFYELCLAAAAVAVFVLLSMYTKYRLKKKELEQKEVYSMVDEIIEILQEHYEVTKGNDSHEPPYLAVQHVRDQLLPPSTRHKLQPIWDKAVAFIAANESRVRLETRLIQGDEFEVWQWLQSPLPDSRNRPSLGSVVSKYIERDNTVSQRSTPCLKVCKMFNSSLETDDGWEEQVIDAVLEKCRGIDRIVHVCVDADAEEGCVFMKCSSLEAAIEAKDELHGWRRKGRAVTVKYMKTDDYHKLFPDARYATQSLYPSSRGRV